MRLIDADELKDLLQDYEFNDKHMLSTIETQTVLEWIEEQPTAYDVDKVVKKIESIQNECDLHSDYGLGAYAKVGRAIEVVKAGGIYG